MADTATKKVVAKKPKAVKAPAAHPPVAQMVVEAIKELKERKGSSKQAISKYMSTHYKVDMDRLNVHVKMFLRKGVADGKLVQTKGTGASGSFKVPKDAKPEKKAIQTKKPAAKKPNVAKKPTTKTTPKKKASTKSPAKKATKPKVAKKPKTPKKATKKPATKKPAAKKSPKKAAKKPAAKKSAKK